MLVSKRIEPFFRMTQQKQDGDNTLVEGMLTCCNAMDFEVFVAGEIRHRIFSKMCLFPKNNRIILEARCKKCGKAILVFDSSCDGYEQCGNNQYTHITTKHINCKKCLDDCYSVIIRYEYPNAQELDELEFKEIQNAFTWIWITLVCNSCGTSYLNFVDYETS